MLIVLVALQLEQLLMQLKRLQLEQLLALEQLPVLELVQQQVLELQRELVLALSSRSTGLPLKQVMQKYEKFSCCAPSVWTI
ncbi:MAG TPA: hypothetical protein VN030_02400 [Cellvibrio sp.]|nr:hypothetical protein [Cellvibrio sp.]